MAGWFGPQAGGCSCCGVTPPCQDIVNCECGFPSAPFTCFTISVSGIAASASGQGTDYSSYLNADYVVECDGAHDVQYGGAVPGDDVYTTDDQFVGVVSVWTYWTFKPGPGDQSYRACLSVASIISDGSVNSWAKVHKWCWAFSLAVDEETGCIYRSCTPVLISETECCVSFDFPVFPGDIPLTTSISCASGDAQSCSDPMPVGAGDAADHLLDFSSISASITASSC